MRCIPTDAQGTTLLGVDAHKDTHVGVALDGLGRRLGTLSIPTTNLPAPGSEREAQDGALAPASVAEVVRLYALRMSCSAGATTR
jgi:hypothetical protein